jgi:hypothetical protein
MDTQKIFILDLFIDGDYVETQTKSQSHPMTAGETIWVEVHKTGMQTFAKVLDTFFVSDDEYHLYLETV